MNTTERDRYITFAGLDCDQNATVVIDRVRHHIANTPSIGPWADYFEKKLGEQVRLGVDDLFLVGSQINALYALFEACEDEEGADLLYQVEQECC